MSVLHRRKRTNYTAQALADLLNIKGEIVNIKFDHEYRMANITWVDANNGEVQEGEEPPGAMIRGSDPLEGSRNG